MLQQKRPLLTPTVPLQASMVPAFSPSVLFTAEDLQLMARGGDKWEAPIPSCLSECPDACLLTAHNDFPPPLPHPHTHT